MIQLKDWLISTFRLDANVSLINEVLMAIALENRFNPVKDYLNSVTWDQVPRIDSWLRKYLNASGPDKYLASVGSKTLMAMVARILEPGIKFDNVLILEGEQGIGKSTTARVLAGDKWFSDSGIDMNSKDAVVNMQGIWVYELGELSALSRSETNRIKQFISSQTDKIRLPYGKRTGDYPRQGIFIGTTNNDEYLKDTTGNRRYWPVKCGKVNISGLARDRDQLLAEAMDRYILGEDLWIKNKFIEQLVASEQHQRVEIDEIQDYVSEYLKSENIGEFFKLTKVIECPSLTGMKFDRIGQLRLSGALKNLGYKKIKRMVNGERGNWWVKNDQI